MGRVSYRHIGMKVTFTIADLKADPRWVLDYALKEGAVNIACDGEIVAELRPVDSQNGSAGEDKKQTLEERLDDFRKRGILVSSGKPRRPFKLGEPSPGVLERFLADRNE